MVKQRTKGRQKVAETRRGCPKSVEAWPKLPNIGPKSSQSWPKLVQIRPKLVLIRWSLANSVEIPPTSWTDARFRESDSSRGSVKPLLNTRKERATEV